MTNSTMLFVILLSSLTIGCAEGPKRPSGTVMGINARPTSEPAPYALTFNLETDFDENLRLKPDAKGVRVPITLDQLHAHWAMNAQTKEELVRYALEWKQKYLNLKKRCEAP